MKPLFDNRDFIEWIAKQPANRRYNYENCKTCLIARYLKHRGLTNFSVQKDYVLSSGPTGSMMLPDGWNAVAEGKGRTFGAAHQRALALLEART